MTQQTQTRDKRLSEWTCSAYDLRCRLIEALKAENAFYIRNMIVEIAWRRGMTAARVAYLYHQGRSAEVWN